MKKNLFVMIALLLTTSVFAQEAEVSKLRAGLGVVYASKIENFGLSLDGIYSFTDNWEGELALTHVFKKDDVKYNVVDLNARYNFVRPVKNLAIYGLGGLALNFVWLSDDGKSSYTQTKVGFNLGLGATYRLTDKLSLAPQACCMFSDDRYYRYGLAVQYQF